MDDSDWRMRGQSVLIVESNQSMLDSISAALGEFAFSVHSIASFESFNEKVSQVACVIVGPNIPEANGVASQLVSLLGRTPVIFIVPKCSVPLVVQRAAEAQSSGAVQFLEEPFDIEELTALVAESVDRRQNERIVNSRISERMERLTRRENEVLAQIVAGQPNKKIAASLGISRRTVETHRSNMMQKLEVDSLAELVHLSLQCGDATAFAQESRQTSIVAGPSKSAPVT